jgi:carbonic anhydrase
MSGGNLEGRSMRILPVIIVAAIPMLGARAQTTDYSHYVSPWKTPWDYAGPRGPANWGSLDAAYAACTAGKEQSPVDIQSTRKAKLPSLHFEYRSAPLQYVINNGHTIRVDYHDTPPAGSFLIIGDKRYQLTQFHFHRPSEEYVRGKQYEMVLHLMHKSADGEELGVAVLLTRGRANPVIAKVWSDMPGSEGQRPAPGIDLNPAGMLPAALGYFTYTGSVTAPPCTEGVKWIVLKTPVELSAAQIDAFAMLYPDDVRPLQPLNGRIVQESE